MGTLAGAAHLREIDSLFSLTVQSASVLSYLAWTILPLACGQRYHRTLLRTPTRGHLLFLLPRIGNRLAAMTP